jgi:uncharacterized UPF0160 family protein
VKKIDIWTHNGLAHRDDFLSACILLASYNVGSIFRRPSQEYNINSKLSDDIWFDVGNTVDYTQKVFDHHQVKQPLDKPECAFSLVLQYITGLSYDELKSNYTQFDFIVRQDNFGPIAAYKQCFNAEVSISTFAETMSPIEMYCLEEFSRLNEIKADSDLARLMTVIGKEIIAKIYSNKSFKKSLPKLVKSFTNGKVIAIDSVISRDQSIFLDKYLSRKYKGYLVKVSRSSQNPKQWCALRLNDKLNFNNMQNADTSFIHTNGFFAVWNESISLDEVIDNIESIMCNG